MRSSHLPSVLRVFPQIPQRMHAQLLGVPGRHKQMAIGSYYAVAIAQRTIGERALETWPPPRATADVACDLVMFTCRRDRQLAARSLTGFIRHVGEPASILIVSDGSVSGSLAGRLNRLSPKAKVVSWDELLDPSSLPGTVRRYAEIDALGRKLAVLMQLPVSDVRPTVFVDSDVEFFPSAAGMRPMLERSDSPVQYMSEPGNPLDLRIVGGRVNAGVNSGFVIFPRPLDWEIALVGLSKAMPRPSPTTEQTVFAIAATAAGGEPLPMEKFVVSWDDLKWPWDLTRKRGAYCRHYLSWLQRWKMWLRGGPKGFRTLPAALLLVIRQRRVASAGPNED